MQVVVYLPPTLQLGVQLWWSSALLLWLELLLKMQPQLPLPPALLANPLEGPTAASQVCLCLFPLKSLLWLGLQLKTGTHMQQSAQPFLADYTLQLGCCCVCSIVVHPRKWPDMCLTLTYCAGSKSGLPDGKDPELDSEVAKKKDPFFKEVDKRT